MGLWLRIVLVTWVVSVDPALVFASHLLTSALMYRSNVDRFSATYSYDAMSNLTAVKRRGIVDHVDMGGPQVEVHGTLDDISISYDGNRISSVTAKTDAVAFEGMTGMGRNESDMSVSYDDAGRIVSDETRGITLIEYNNDGHPVRMVLDEGHEFHDAWDGLGNHLSTTIYMMQPSGTLNELALMVREYRGNGQIITSYPSTGQSTTVMTRFPGGYFMGNEVYYYVTDYQGNNIAVVDGDGKIVEQTNYYPYGEPWREATEQPFLYAGNERLRLFGLNEYDFIARRYNPLLASFTTWDPLAEKYPWLSPYAYCAGNPINYIDPNGLRIKHMIDGIEYEYEERDDVWGFYNASGQLYTGTSEYLSSLEAIRTANSLGQKVIEDLVASDRDVVLNYTTGENRFRGNESEGELEIYWNPTAKEGGIGINEQGIATRERNPISGLAHELGHAYDYTNPNSLFDINLAVKNFVINLHFNVDRFEILPCIIENSIRASIGDPIRKSYNTLKTENGYSVYYSNYLNYTFYDYFLLLNL